MTSRSATLPIEEVAASARIAAEHLEPYGRYIAKVAPTAPAALSDRAPTKYIVITAVTPTHLGEGKTTFSIGLAQGLALLGHKSMLSPRQPSLGPTFGTRAARPEPAVASTSLRDLRTLRAAVGAGYVYAICGEMRTMPGLPKHPAAERIDIDQDGNVVGLS